MKHNKLVRDKIPDIIIRNGEQPITKILDADAYRLELRRKLQEEVDEFCKSGKPKELVDVLEVIYTIAAAEGVSRSQLEKVRKQKRRERGGFDQRVFLIETTKASSD